MRIELGARVRSFDGHNVGRIDKFIVDPASGRLLAAVVRQGFILTSAVAIPIDWLNPAASDEVACTRTAAQIQALPSFEDWMVREPPEDLPNSYGYPTEGVLLPQTYPFPLGVPEDVVAATEGEDQLTGGREAVLLDADADIVTAEGEDIGDLRGVVVDPVTGIPDRIVVETEVAGLPEEIEVSAEHAERIEHEEVRLDVSREDLEHHPS